MSNQFDQEQRRPERVERVEFVATFVGSGAITDKILQRFPAEVAVLSSQLDALRLVKTGTVVEPIVTRKSDGHG